MLVSGIIYTARDAAHKRIIESLDSGEELLFDPRGQTIYYAAKYAQNTFWCVW